MIVQTQKYSLRVMKISYCFTILFLVLRGDGNSDSLQLLYPTYKVVEDAVMGNPEIRFILKQTFFPSSSYRYWQVDGAEAIPINVCVTLNNNTNQPGILTNNETDCTRNCTGSWKFLWTNSLLLNIIPADILLAMDTMSIMVYSEIIKSSRYRLVTLYVHLNEHAFSCTPSLDDIEQAFVLLLSTVSFNNNYCSIFLHDHTYYYTIRLRCKSHQTQIQDTKVM